jgi:hypothetical protein
VFGADGPAIAQVGVLDVPVRHPRPVIDRLRPPPVSVCAAAGEGVQRLRQRTRDAEGLEPRSMRASMVQRGNRRVAPIS